MPPSFLLTRYGWFLRFKFNQFLDKNTTSSTKGKGDKSEDKPTESKKDEDKPTESKKDKEKPVKEPQEDEKSPPSVEEEHNTVYLDEEMSEKSTTEKSEENVTEQPSTTETSEYGIRNEMST